VGQLTLERVICLTYFLADQPRAIDPAIALTPDGRMAMVYEGESERRLWSVVGRFVDDDRLLRYEGGQHRLSLVDDAGRLGSALSIALRRDGQAVTVYEGTDEERLYYLSGRFALDGELAATEFSLTDGDARRGYTPTTTFLPDGRLIVVYRGTSDERLYYVTGSVDADGRINGPEFSLTDGDARRGKRPSVAVSSTGTVLIAYEGTEESRIYYVTGTVDRNGRLSGTEHRLSEGDHQLGFAPAVAFDAMGRVHVAYEGTDNARLYAVSGDLDASGRIVGTERQLAVSLNPV
jgi:hypothetical protein